MPRGSSSKGKQPAKDWAWTDDARKLNLSAYVGKIETLSGRFDHKDFRLSRAWICFAEENVNDDVRTNHVSLKFDFKRCNDHRWRGVEAQVVNGQTFRHPVSNQELTAAAVVLDLKEWEGPPNGTKYCVEMETNFDSIYGGTTLGNFISDLSGARLLRFGFGTKVASNWDEAHVGCRDYVAQVLFALGDRIRKRPVKGWDRTIATRTPQNGALDWSKGARQLFSDIYAALAIYCEELMDPQTKKWCTVVSSSAVEEGYFPDRHHRDQRARTEDGYPYQVADPFGTRSDRVGQTSQISSQVGSTGQRGGYGGQAGTYGGQAGTYGGQAGTYGGVAGTYGGQGRGYGGQGRGYGSPSGPSMPGPSGYYYYK